MGKVSKTSKQRYFRHIRPTQQQQQQPPPQNELFVRLLNVAVKLFTAGVEAVILQRNESATPGIATAISTRTR